MIRKPSGVGFLGLPVLVLVAFLPVVLRQQTLMPCLPGVLPGGRPGNSFLLDPMDTSWHTYPLARTVHALWRSGVPPLWNRLSGCGEPLVPSSLGSVTSPLRLWTALVDPGPAIWDYFLLGRLALAGILAWLLALRLGLSSPASFATAAAFMLSGHLVLNMNQGFVDADVLLPALGLALVAARSGRPMAYPAVALAWGAILLAGQPQAGLSAAVFAVALAVSRPVLAGGTGARDCGGKPVGLPGGLFAACAGCMLAAPFLFPFLDFLPRAWHAHSGQGWSFLPLKGGVSWIAPWLLDGYGANRLGLSPFLLLPYAGAATVALALAGLPRTLRNPAGPGIAVAAGFLLCLAYGIPPLSWLGRLPLLDSMWWSKYQGPAALGIALMAGFGVDSIAVLMNAVPGGGRRKRVLVWAIPAIVVAELCILMPRVRPAPHDPLAEDPYVGYLRSVVEPGRDRVWGVGRVLMPHTTAALGIPDVRTYFAVYPVRAYWYIRTLVTGPAGSGNDAIFTGSPRVFPALSAPALSALAARWIVTDREPGNLAASLSPVPVQTWNVFGDRGRAGTIVAPDGPEFRLELSIPAAGARLTGMWAGPASLSIHAGGEDMIVSGSAEGWRDFSLDLAPFVGRKVGITFRLRGNRAGFLADLVFRSGTGVALDPAGHPLPGLDRIMPRYDRTVMVFENTRAMPRARIASRSIRVPGPRENIFETSGAPAGDVAWVEGPVDWPGFGARCRPQPARIITDTGNTVVIGVPGEGTRVLVLADTWEPGWRAYSPECRLAVLPADCMFRAVAVPSGVRRIVFRYEPLPFKLGLFSGGAAAGMLVVWALAAITQPGPRARGSARS